MIRVPDVPVFARIVFAFSTEAASIHAFATRMPSRRFSSSGSARFWGALFEMCWQTVFVFWMIAYDAAVPEG